jgi:hypothetical protein
MDSCLSACICKREIEREMEGKGRDGKGKDKDILKYEELSSLQTFCQHSTGSTLSSLYETNTKD